MEDDGRRERRLAEIGEKYGPAVEAWCRSKEAEEGDIPSEERISRRISPSDRPPPPA